MSARETAPNCPYYFEDFHRGREVIGCRLIERNPNSLPWERKLCSHCPVPRILRETTSQAIALEAKVEKKFPWGKKITVFAVCTKHMLALADPLHCPRCEAEAAEEATSSRHERLHTA